MLTYIPVSFLFSVIFRVRVKNRVTVRVRVRDRLPDRWRCQCRHSGSMRSQDACGRISQRSSKNNF